jgi:hypothetical protein
VFLSNFSQYNCAIGFSSQALAHAFDISPRKVLKITYREAIGQAEESEVAMDEPKILPSQIHEATEST